MKLKIIYEEKYTFESNKFNFQMQLFSKETSN